jgi:hypothetical protein
MPQIICLCENILSYSEIPCSIEYKFISDVEYDQYQETINAEDLYQNMKSFLKCPKCDRLWVFWNGYTSSPTEYIKNQLKKNL